MIARDTAASIVGLLEGALDHLLKAHTLVERAPSHHPAAQQMEALWLPTANTAGMLAVIDEAYPDLVGPDVSFREPAVQDAGKGSREPNVERIRIELKQALELLERAGSSFVAAQEMNPTERDRFQARFAESMTALRSAVESLASL